ncbi:exopolyphosphatase / guanosine-5'-triphosphate,3'-diphosphate pyrophosphatase [Erythrobacter litoralis]|uniref:Exopolyphosphatase n=1 Tax=Erythrobacter litoralis TaxID=39960 RepID=A0A074MC29_9SPHN|nr:Ppx/GppA phosphatase family protein [Erythrobacter litoralis]AOL22540.1 exopolyphosphatase / guanosine-5'-triphosphate,3'-diphosphate pyrophosphatase [Erythrobacter litoralis]KEO92356.1 exopolyphosphatase [Erythrobacter litoralis]
MADTVPPDDDRRAGNQRGAKSGTVADPRYARSFQPDERTERLSRGRLGQGRNPDSNANDAGPSRRGNAPGRSARPDAFARGPARGSPFRGEAYAALDLGTNNCRLLIARPSGRDFTVIDAFSRVVKLGEGLATTGRLSDQAMDRALGALSICADKLRRRNVRLARSVATEACRRAENGADFIERVRRETGIALDIISAEEEARLAVLGCHILLEAGEGPAMIFDIGGGSTELVLLEAGDAEGRRVPRILDWQSVPWGVVSLTDTVGHDDGLECEAGRAARLARYRRMRELVGDSFADFAERIGEAPRASDIRLLGTSGTVTTLASLHLELPHYDRKAVDGLIVSSHDMRAISTRLSGMSPAERSTLPCIGNDRADLVVAGCAILETILDLWPAARLGVADRGIREGILRSLMAAERQGERALKKLRERPQG